MVTTVELIKAFLKQFDLAITRYSKLEKLKTNLGVAQDEDIELLIASPYEHVPDIVRYLRQSMAQNRQDLFVLSQLNFKRNGFFVEFGASNGIVHSNTLFLEKEFGWTGILAEPARRWHEELRKNRKAAIETLCVWKETNRVLVFNEVDATELSTIDIYSEADGHKDKRANGKRYEVMTISINDFLRKHNAPRCIDYLSIDTEGSEFEILNAFDFEKYSVGIITCEHNFTPMREKISSLLSQRGYERKYERVSQQDDWYVKVNQ